MYHPTCRICQRELPLSRRWLIINDRRFCKEHYKQYKMRQQNGVATDELDAQWVDSLDNWRDRPIELDHEIGKKPFSSLLFFSQNLDNWLLFRRFYIVRNGHKTMAGVIVSTMLQSLRRNKRTVTFKTKKGRKSRMRRPRSRMADVLAVNTQTGEIRRFVDVSEEMVSDDLRGIRSAPYQAEIAHLWGNSDPTGIEERFEQQYREDNQRILIPALVHLCPFPVFGLIGNPLGFSPGYSMGHNGDARHGIRAITFHFSSPQYPQKQNILELTSSDPRERNLFYSHEHAIETLIWQYSHRDPRNYASQELAQFGTSSLWEGEMIIAAMTFSATIDHWTEPEQITLFRLKGEKVIVSGHSFGLHYADLLQLLKEAQPINDQDDVLAAYQRAADEGWQRLMEQYKQKSIPG